MFGSGHRKMVAPPGWLSLNLELNQIKQQQQKAYSLQKI
jgi:hypothetical protein